MERVNGPRADMNLRPSALWRWRAGPPSASLTWTVGLLLATALNGFFGGLVGGLHAESIFERYPFLSDANAAKVVSGIDLYAVSTNLWYSAEEERAGKIVVRAALDKARYQLGEPVHLFLYYLHHSAEITAMPKLGKWLIIRPTVVDRQNRPVRLTSDGEWHASFSNLVVPGAWAFSSNQVKIAHIDLTELVHLSEPGKYFVFPKIRLYPESSNVELPDSAELRAIEFEVTTNSFESPTNVPRTEFAAMYQQHIDELGGHRRPLTDLEKELSAQSEQMMKEGLERHRLFMEEVARKAAATNPPVVPARVAVPETRLEAAGSSRRRFGLPLLGGGAALLLAFWFLRRRGD